MDLIDSLCHHEPNLKTLVLLIDDSLRPRHLAAACRPSPLCTIHELSNPRRGQGSGWAGGLATGVTHGMRWIAEQTRAPFVVRLDTDALVIGPFVGSVSAAFQRMPNVGMLGSYTRTCQRARRAPANHPIAKIQEKLLRPFAIWKTRSPRRSLQISAIGRWRKINQALSMAVAQGYQLGDFVHGGAYAVRSSAIESAMRLGLLDDPLAWVNTQMSEDVVVSILISAAGYRLADLVDDGHPFAVQAVGLPDDPQKLIDRGFAIIHSLKGDTRLCESEIREFFAAKRNTEL